MTSYTPIDPNEDRMAETVAEMGDFAASLQPIVEASRKAERYHLAKVIRERAPSMPAEAQQMFTAFAFELEKGPIE
ncbi:hypothetical protein H6F43_03965 [Leptolyngbya sp. FACHB-36]|uniref:hypothetical protein n=1 Tax=Leptolyngbya sp. FACHB-36 TaxID=2692808 RepID=UPI00168104FD|nr:hypothetical protein [Leptolyngbya sp. FACHB-36]MBD2019339.1 hypothetical protein [Leptolyngbya sp. FACHB-36]